MRIVAIVQARMGSTRLPGKVLKKLAGIPAIEILLARLSRSKLISEICVATTVNVADDVLCLAVERLGHRVHRGSEADVLQRFCDAANATSAELIVRITGDCPLIDAHLIDKMINVYMDEKRGYLSNTNPPTFPDGLDVEIFTAELLHETASNATSDFDREHVTSYMRTNCAISKNFYDNDDNSYYRLTLDDHKDLMVLQTIFQRFSPDIHFSYLEAVKIISSQKELTHTSRDTKRNAGATMTENQKKYERAKNVILGGTSLLSKRPEMFLPEHWPVYFKKTSGVKIVDLDGIEYTDMGIMGVGTNTLGYSHPEVDDAVRKVVDQGNLSSLNCFEEVELADKLLSLNPWASKVRYARTGGEANAVAVRIARCSSRSPKIAVCGYHGWHDWYLAANLGKTEGLDGHLMPGLEPNGVPRDLSDTVFTFNYNDIDRLSHLVNHEDIGIIKMEVQRNTAPKDDFLNKVRKLADGNNIILIFDECSSGFRETFGGLFKKFNVVPDIAIYGKTLGNGYAITAIVGTEKVMQRAQDSFISSTFWTERIGPAAALKTLEIMEREKSWDVITKIGKQYREQLYQICNDIGLHLEISGLPALTNYAVTENCKLEAKTYIIQELLKKGILATTAFYPSIMHKDEHLEIFFKTLKPILEHVQTVQNSKASFDELLDGPICHGGFKRLN